MKAARPYLLKEQKKVFIITIIPALVSSYVFNVPRALPLSLLSIKYLQNQITQRNQYLIEMTSTLILSHVMIICHNNNNMRWIFEKFSISSLGLQFAYFLLLALLPSEKRGKPVIWLFSGSSPTRKPLKKYPFMSHWTIVTSSWPKYSLCLAQKKLLLHCIIAQG